MGKSSLFPVFLVAGLIFAIWGAVKIGSGAELYFGPSVKGKITSLEIEEMEISAGTEDDIIRYRPIVFYKYSGMVHQLLAIGF